MFLAYAIRRETSTSYCMSVVMHRHVRAIRGGYARHASQPNQLHPHITVFGAHHTVVHGVGLSGRLVQLPHHLCQVALELGHDVDGAQTDGRVGFLHAHQARVLQADVDILCTRAAAEDRFAVEAQEVIVEQFFDGTGYFSAVAFGRLPPAAGCQQHDEDQQKERADVVHAYARLGGGKKPPS